MPSKAHKRRKREELARKEEERRLQKEKEEEEARKKAVEEEAARIKAKAEAIKKKLHLAWDPAAKEGADYCTMFDYSNRMKALYEIFPEGQVQSLQIMGLDYNLNVPPKWNSVTKEWNEDGIGHGEATSSNAVAVAAYASGEKREFHTEQIICRGFPRVLPDDIEDSRLEGKVMLITSLHPPCNGCQEWGNLDTLCTKYRFSACVLLWSAPYVYLEKQQQDFLQAHAADPQWRVKKCTFYKARFIDYDSDFNYGYYGYYMDSHTQYDNNDNYLQQKQDDAMYIGNSEYHNKNNMVYKDMAYNYNISILITTIVFVLMCIVLLSLGMFICGVIGGTLFAFKTNKEDERKSENRVDMQQDDPV